MTTQSSSTVPAAKYATGLSKLFTILWVLYWILLVTFLISAGVLLALRGPGDGFGHTLMMIKLEVGDMQGLMNAKGDSLDLDGPTGFIIAQGLYMGTETPLAATLLSWGSFVMITLVGGAVLYRLRRVVRAYAGRQPFLPRNAGDIRWVGWLIIGGSLLFGLTSYLAHSFAMKGIPLEEVDALASFQFQPIIILSGLLVLLLAEVFRYGAQLQNESDLTV